MARSSEDPKTGNQIAVLLEALKSVPLKLSVSVALAGWLVVLFFYFPSLAPGFDFEEARGRYGWLILFGSIAFTLLAVLTSVERLTAWRNRRPRQPFHPALEHGDWVATPQPDGSIVSQLVADFRLQNTSDSPFKVLKLRLIRPKAEALTAHASIGWEGGEYSTRTIVPPRTEANARFVVVTRGTVQKPDRPLDAVFGVTDKDGCEWRVKATLKPYRRGKA